MSGYLERTPVKSTNIASIGYDSWTNTLEVEFKASGVYEYLSVPKQVYLAFMAAKSKGLFFHENIRDKYRYNCLTPKEKKEHGKDKKSQTKQTAD